MDTIARPAYRTLVPGQRHFACEPLRASAISTAACAQQWAAAKLGSACQQCAIGRLHHADHNPGATASARRRLAGDRLRAPCVRCDRTDLRIVSGLGLCISDFNRTREVLSGSNSKGTAPVKLQLWNAEVAIQHSDGRIERRLIPVAHQAEALARVLRAMPDGAKLLTGERRRTAWNRLTSQFELVCNQCGEQGLVLERVRDGVLQRHAWCCAGEPKGGGWEPAKVRRPIIGLNVHAVAADLSSDPDLADEQPGVWTRTAYACTCGSGQVEGLLTVPSGQWRARCQACGAASQ